MQHSPEAHRSPSSLLTKATLAAAVLIGGCQDSVAADARHVLHAKADTDDDADTIKPSEIPMVNRVISPKSQEELADRMQELQLAYTSILMTRNMLEARIDMGDKSEETVAARDALTLDMANIRKQWERKRSWYMVGGAVRG